MTTASTTKPRSSVEAVKLACQLPTGHDGGMTTADASRMHVTIHLSRQSTVSFEADHLWPLRGAYARFGNELSSLAEEVTRRLHTDGYIGFSAPADRITAIPLSAVKRIDFSGVPMEPTP
jgi:hypothetical protein